MKNNKAFTLVELIIVIAVIGVLAAILIPVFSNVIDKANAKSALSDAKNSMEQVIIEGTENAAMPENIVIIVRKAGKFYVYGFNRVTDDRLYQSPGNPFRGFSDVQSLIAQRSWNALQGDTAPDLETAYTDHDTYGYFYLVPYSGGVPQSQTVRGMRAVSEYPEISDPANGLMTENMGEDVHVFHGVLTDKTDIEVQTAGAGSAEPTQSASPDTTPQAGETPAPTDTTTRTYHVELSIYYYDGRPLSLGGNAVKARTDRELSSGDNYVPSYTVTGWTQINCPDFGHFLDNEGWMFRYVEQGDTTLTPLDNINIRVDDVNAETIYGNLYVAIVRKPEAPSDNSQLNSGRYWLKVRYFDADTGNEVGLNPNVPDTSAANVFYDLDLTDTTYLPVSDLKAAAKFPQSPMSGYHYEAIERYAGTNEPLTYIEIDWTYEPQVLPIEINVYVKLMPNT